MKFNRLITLTSLSACCAMVSAATPVHFDMTLNANGTIVEESTGTCYSVASQLPPVAVDGIDGSALRFDGYSNYVRAALPTEALPTEALPTEALTINIMLAAETYPMMNVAEAEATPSYATVCGNYDEANREGFALKLSSQGDLRFNYCTSYANGYAYTINGSSKLECGRWNLVTAVLDKSANAATLYLNGEAIGTAKMGRAAAVHSAADFFIGKDATEQKSDVFLINTFCGLIDDIAIYDEAWTADQVAAAAATVGNAIPDFAYPAERYAESLWRPQFHGMPSGGWTNECHGMTFSDGRYHVFFQKNANGPYMARLHWGHISSADLCSWREEPIALRPAESYDLKGCWSGCVFTDETLTGGKPNIIYTAVDNARAVIAQAAPDDDALNSWTKSAANPIINGRPSGLSDDFRDPYFFTANGQRYIIVGTSKDGVGACTLHRYADGSWSNDGSIFFRGTNANQHGTFWEMPNVTDMGGGKYLFTCTPLGMGNGVSTIYWVGTIAADGTFSPDSSSPQSLELNGIGRDGYGLLSPTIYNDGTRTLLLGIVPDKLPGYVNAQMGWAHNYSLPREISLAADGTLAQKPYSGLTAMRTATATSFSSSLSGTLSLSPVNGRQIELLGRFTVGQGSFGFNFLKSGSNGVSLTYYPDRGTLTLDMTSLARTVNDGGSYGGIYSADLPVKPAVGEVLTLHVYLDGSIADIFVNDRWAFAVRIFPTDAAAVEAEAFATAATAATINAWTLDPASNGQSGITEIASDAFRPVMADAVYDLYGRRLAAEPLSGVYVKNGRKLMAH